jgi:Ring finger domain
MVVHECSRLSVSPYHYVQIYAPDNTDNESGSLQTVEEENTNESVTTKSNCSGDTDIYDAEEALQNPQCAICFEPFKNGDAISSSRNNKCQHIFHRQCIFEWLLKHEGCPFCRRNYLSSESSCDVEAGLPAVIGHH